jgi:protein involved in polysaccharide export with SLBB domain
MGLMRAFAVVHISLLVCLLLGCSRGVSTKAPIEAPVEDTTMGPGDVFEVRVFGEEKLSGKYQVGPDGNIRFPLVGVVPARGREADQVATEIADRLKQGQYLREPHVSIYVLESNSRRVSVLGAVAKPGTFPIVPGMTVVQAVSNAGGFTPLASKDDSVVTRRVNGKLERYRIPVSQITRGDLDDFPLRAGDIVFVPERVF